MEYEQINLRNHQLDSVHHTNIVKFHTEQVCKNVLFQKGIRAPFFSSKQFTAIVGDRQGNISNFNEVTDFLILKVSA